MAVGAAGSAAKEKTGPSIFSLACWFCRDSSLAAGFCWLDRQRLGSGMASVPAPRSGGFAFAEPLRLVQQHGQTLGRRLHLRAYSLASMPSETARGSIRCPSPSVLRPARRRFVARFVAVVGDPAPALCRTSRRRGPVIVGEAIHAIAGRHVAEPAHQNVSASMSDSHRMISFEDRQRLFVPHAAVRRRAGTDAAACLRASLP